ncbi:cupin domain-containing protein [Pseudomonas sp. WHRI 8519]|uniref:cupin domain-containing protein n=1 Tax=Pseudomonas sp. WHRI 8519 TaxID=3162567 RepID=UPI0032EBA7C9
MTGLANLTETTDTSNPHQDPVKPPTPELQQTVGQRLRALREQKELTLRRLAALSGVSHPAIMQIERDLSSPSVSVLHRLLKPLEVTLSGFFSDATNVDAAVFYKADELTEIADGKMLSYRQVGANLTNRSMMILHERWAPGADSGDECYSHEAEEGGVVIKGRLVITLGEETRILEEGDAYYFDSRIPHKMHNPFDEECVVVSAVSPPTF